MSADKIHSYKTGKLKTITKLVIIVNIELFHDRKQFRNLIDCRMIY